ncbi:hypothetical protein [Cystobacter ferrugineus]|uniref:Uncharacterized protein n=1 Tax=Cystobacter ferrugineus TaxID=83449 RepID=A0A1L9B3A0_9BACT|nr:hypothetical protein [Cystobacter ferrugineus]OJH36724.1 hypothetical protein BON30_29885 [Cystobacter ferrugineus]
MNHFKTYGFAVMAIAFSACGPAPEGTEQAESGVARTESALTKAIPNTTCVVEATEPYTYDSGPYANKISAQASVWDCSQYYPIIYVCSTLEKKSVSSTGAVTWTTVPGSRSCFGETNLDFGGQTATPSTYSAGTYRQRAETAIKLNATTWTPAQPSTCGTLSSNVPCAFTAVTSAGIAL